MQIVLVEVKGDASWDNAQLCSKAKRLERIFAAGQPGSDLAVPRFVMMSPKKYSKKNLKHWPDWMKPNGKPLWIELTLPEGLMKPTRCSNNGIADASGCHIRIDEID